MTLNTKTALVATAAAAALVLPWVSYQRTAAHMRRESQSIRRELDQVLVDNERLQKLLAVSQAAEGAAQEQLSELMKLRSEIGELRKRNTELQRLSTAQAAAAPTDSPEPPAEELPPAISKATWSYSGYATPEAALQTFMWSMREGDLKTYLASLAPEARESALTAFEGTPEAEAGVRLQAGLRGIEGLRFKRKTTESPDEVAFVIAASEEDNGSVRMRSEAVLRFKQIGGEWKSVDAAN